MLPKKLKIPIKEFPQRSTLCFRGERFSIKKVANKYDYPRFGVVVSKKTSPKATVRNWVKRTTYNFFGEHLSKIPKGTDLLVVVGGHIMEVSLETKEALRKELTRAIETLK
ncbi:MAG: ribonuclease P protein component [Candidatus Colwellbacteria bacterium]|nr:ribonuclease P protein component [Candidatus Colwellbacteria bacterium]